MDEHEHHRQMKARRAELARPTEEVAASLVGVDADAARRIASERGCVFRISVRDGIGEVLTAEWRSDRINAAIEQGRVISTEVG